MLNAAELNRRRNRVLGAIDELSVVDSLKVLSEAMRELAQQADAGRPAAANDAEPSSVDLILAGEVSRLKVTRDLEVKDFIHGLRGPLSIPQIAVECKARFGDRAPSENALYRYFDSLKYRRGMRGKQHD